MALILSIDTATKVCSVALHQDGQLLVSQHLYIDKSHSGLLTVLISNTLQYAGCKLSDLSAVVVSEGPGSYTGLRIGTSTAKGLGFSLEIPVIVVNTLQAMAWGVRKFVEPGSLLCPMIDARRMEVYYLLMDTEGKVIAPPAPKVIEGDSFKRELDNQKIIFFGDGAEKTKPILGVSKNASFIPEVVPSAVHVGEIGWEKFKERDFVDLAYFEPFYLKDFQGPKPKK